MPTRPSRRSTRSSCAPPVPDENRAQGEDTWARLRRRKVVQWGVAYVAAAWGFLQGLEYVVESFGWPAQLRQVAILALLVGLPIALVIAWYHGDRGEQRVSGTELAIIGLLFLMGGGIFWRYEWAGGHATPRSATSDTALETRGSIDARPSVAVLPFANMTTDPDNEILADGIAETLLTTLAQVRELKVIGRTSSFSYKGKTVDLRTIGRELGAGTLLEGSLQRVGDRLRVTAQLVNAADGAHLWAQTYDRPLADIFAVQDEIAQNVTRALAVTLAGTSEEGSAGTRNFEAYELFLRGGRLVWERGAESVPEGVALLEKAVVLDPQFGWAWGALSHGYVESSDGGGRWFTGGSMPFEQASDRAIRAARRAVEVGPDLGWAHATLAKALNFAGQPGGDAAMARALELSPDDSTILGMQASNLRLLEGRWTDALELLRRALAVDPKNADLHLQIAMALDASGDLDAALGHYRQVIRLAPDSRRGYLMAGLTLRSMIGRGDEALRFLGKAAALDPGDDGIRMDLAFEGLAIGDATLVEQQLHQLRHARGSREHDGFLAEMSRLAGRADAARTQLQTQLEREAIDDDTLIAWDFLRTSRDPAEAGAALRRMLAKDPAWLDKAESGNYYAPICLLVWSGDLARAQRIVAAVEPNWRQRNAYSVTTGLAGRGDRLARARACVGRADDAVAELEALVKANFDLDGPRSLAADPAYDELRGDPRFEAIAARIETAAEGERRRFVARRELTDADIEALVSNRVTARSL